MNRLPIEPVKITIPARAYRKPTLESLLGKGYLPRELPPPFNSTTFAAYAIQRSAVWWPASKWTRCASHNLARPGGLRRQLRIPNPISYFFLAKLLVENWTELRSQTWKNLLSASRPQVIKSSDRAVVPRYKYREVPRLRAFHRRSTRYVLCTDIAQFYPTIYTHTIPWALHTKATCKAELTTRRKGANLLGNKIDKALMAINEGQTHGIPIGPDASLVAAEVLLAAVDSDLIARCPQVSGYRYVDDYELSFRSLSDAEGTLVELQNILASYELSLNPRKTKIHELPRALDDSWAHTLGQFQIRDGSAVQQRNDIIALFSLAFELAATIREKPVLRYAVARVRGLTVEENSWHVLQNCLLGAATTEPAALASTFGTLFKVATASNQNVSQSPLAAMLETVILTHAPRAHGSEVAWALWGALAWGLKMSRTVAIAVSAMDDDVVALLALDAETRDLFPAGALNKTAWQLALNQPDVLEGEHWLLAYEANRQGWLSTPAVAQNPAFLAMNTAQVSFYDRTKNIQQYPAAALGIPGGTLPDFYH